MIVLVAGIGIAVIFLATRSAQADGGGLPSSATPSGGTTVDPFKKYDALFIRYGAVEGVDPWMLKAIAMNESSLGEAPSVKRGIASPTNIEGSKSTDGKSWGLMQMTLPTLRDFDSSGGAIQLNDPDYSVRYAAKFIRSLKSQFSQDEFIVKAYNQGAGNTRKEIAARAAGPIDGYQAAAEYWSRYKKNRATILTRQGV